MGYYCGISYVIRSNAIVADQVFTQVNKSLVKAIHLFSKINRMCAVTTISHTLQSNRNSVTDLDMLATSAALVE